MSESCRECSGVHVIVVSFNHPATAHICLALLAGIGLLRVQPQVLLRVAHQRAGLEIMDRMSNQLEAAFEVPPTCCC